MRLMHRIGAWDSLSKLPARLCCTREVYLRRAACTPGRGGEGKQQGEELRAVTSGTASFVCLEQEECFGTLGPEKLQSELL